MINKGKKSKIIVNIYCIIVIFLYLFSTIGYLYYDNKKEYCDVKEIHLYNENRDNVVKINKDNTLEINNKLLEKIIKISNIKIGNYTKNKINAIIENPEKKGYKTYIISEIMGGVILHVPVRYIYSKEMSNEYHITELIDTGELSYNHSYNIDKSFSKEITNIVYRTVFIKLVLKIAMLSVIIILLIRGINILKKKKE